MKEYLSIAAYIYCFESLSFFKILLFFIWQRVREYKQVERQREREKFLSRESLDPGIMTWAKTSTNWAIQADLH